MNTSNHRPAVEQEIRGQVARNMSREETFYQFCKERLLRQVQEIQGGGV